MDSKKRNTRNNLYSFGSIHCNEAGQTDVKPQKRRIVTEPECRYPLK
jgi:hypothetical protein